MKRRLAPVTAAVEHEHRLLGAGYRVIVGLDEAGRGAWAGPVAAGAVCLPLDRADLREVLAGVRDSKQMTVRQRTALVEVIKTTAVAWAVGSASAAEIDALGIAPATRLAMRRALDGLATQQPGFLPDYLLLDYIRWNETPLPYPVEHLKKGDQQSLTIAAASVLAKTWRDQVMRELALQPAYADYGFAAHKGYGTAEHLAALRRLGACEQHRATFAPIRHLDQATLW